MQETNQPVDDGSRTYNYGGTVLTFNVNDYRPPKRVVHRRAHVRAKYPESAFDMGELVDVEVREQDAVAFDSGCPNGPVVVVMTKRGVRTHVCAGDAFPVECNSTNWYDDGLPVFYPAKLEDRWLHSVHPTRRKIYY